MAEPDQNSLFQIMEQIVFDFSPVELHFGIDKDFTFEQFKSKPFQVFSPLEKLSKCCDFLQVSKQQAAQRIQEEEFQTVGADKAVQKKKTTKKPVTFVQPQQSVGYPSFRWDHSSQRRSKYTQQYKRTNITKTKFKDSIVIQADWEMVHEAERQIMEKTPLSVVTFEDLVLSGNVKRYNSAFDKTRPLHEKQIPNELDDVISSSTFQDPYLKELANSRQSTDSLPTIYTTDKLLFALMTLKYSVYPWDIFVTKRDNQIIFDKAPENASRTTYLELQTINENTSNDMKEDERVVYNDCEESTYAALNWQHFAVKDQEVDEDLSGEQHATAQYSEDFAYKYVHCQVKERLDKGGKNEELKAGAVKFEVIVRTQIDGADAEGNPVLIKSLNQCEAGQDWRKQLESQSGQLTSSVCVANTNNMAKWLCQAIISEVQEIKVGFITRQQAKDQNKHSLLCVESYKLRDISSIIGFKNSECWQNLRYFVDYIAKQPNGQYVVMKPAYKPNFRIYHLSQRQESSDQEEN